MSKVLVDKDFLEDGLELICDSIRLKTGGSGVLAFPVEIKSAVDSIQTSGGITPTGTKTITANGTGIDVTTFAAVDVAVEGDAQVFDVTLTAAGYSVTVQNAYIENAVGYMLYTVSGVSADQRSTIYQAWCFPDPDTAGKYMLMRRYCDADGLYKIGGGLSDDTDVQYDSTAHTLTVSFYGGNSLQPGQYKLIVW